MNTLVADHATTVQTVFNALPHPAMMINETGHIVVANDAAEQFFQASRAILRKKRLDHYLPFGSPVLALISQVRDGRSPVNEYRVDVSSPRIGADRVIDVYAAPLVNDPRAVVIQFQERTMADKIDRQLTHRGAARSVTGLAGMLAHEIKNPLSGIRGAAQLLEASAIDEDRALTRLITDEADRIVKLVERMEIFSDERPVEREPVNIHAVLEHVKRLAQSGFGRNIRIVERYDPSLPPVLANRDQLVQVFLNLVKNACEAVSGQGDGEVVFSTAFQPGIRLSVPGSQAGVTLPLEFCVIDNGPGIADDVRPYLFDPFVTTKANGTGLGLALVAKIIGDHGGVIDCESQPRRTAFRVLLPASKSAAIAPGAGE